MAGYINVDKYGEPDVRYDLEVFPWPWSDSSVSEVNINHVLEHLGQSTEVYLKIIQELYRVCKNNAIIHIRAPHPRHDDFLTDPTHVRPVTPEGFSLFSQRLNKEWRQDGFSNTSLGLYLKVNLEIGKVKYLPDPYWIQELQQGKITEKDLYRKAKDNNNVFKEIDMEVKVVK